MKRLIILFSLLSGFLYGQTTVTLPPLRGGSLSTFNNSAMITDYAFIETDGVAGFYKLMSGDVTTPASDSVVVKTDNTRWKLLSNLSPTAVAWATVTGKPTIYSSPGALKTALETLTGSARLDTSAIKNLAGITTESDPNVGSHIKAITTDDITAWNAKYGTGAAVVSSLSALTGTNRLPWTALKDVPAETDPNVGSHIKAITTTNITDWTASYRTGAAVVSSLSALSGSARLPASAIKDLPTVSDNSSIQKIETRVGGTLIGTRKSINLIAGSNVTVTGSDNSGSDRVDITLSATGGGGTGMAEPSTNGIAVRTSSGASAARSIVAPAAGITITNGSGVSGDPTLALADDLAGLEGLSTTGYVKRTGTGTFSAGTAIDLSGSEVTGTIAAARMPALTGDIVTTAGAVASTYNNVVPSSKGGAGSVTGLLKANGSGTVSAATSGTDYVVPSGSITGSAATLTTPRSIYGNNFDGSAALTGIIASTYGGTGNGFTKFSGATTSEKTYTLPNATATILTDNAAVTVAQGGTNASTAAGARTNLGLVIGTDVAAIASPTFTGTPAAPTATAGTNTTQIATTAFVKAAIDTRIPYKTITEIRAFTSTEVTATPTVQVTDVGKEGIFRYVAGSSNSDNTGIVLVTTTGSYRYERVFSGAILPEWFGAVGDGSTYDTTPIQNALNYAASVGTGAVVQLSAKNYKVTTLTMPDSVKLIGFNAKLTQVRANGTAIPVITCGNKNEISGLNIICNPVSNTFTNNGGIYVFNKINVTITDCYVKNHGVFGVMIDRGKNVTVRNNRFWTSNQLSDINSSGGTVWSNSSDIFIYTNGGGYTENILVHGNRCNSPFTSQGIWVNGIGYEKNIVISSNICATTNEDGSVWTSTNYWLDSGSGFTRRHGIVASYQSTAESGAILITGNICKTTIVTGIYVSGVGGGKGVNVTGNTCIDNGYTTNSDRSLAGGIAVTGSTGLAHIVGNTVIDFKANSTECGAINVQRNLGNNTVHNVYLADNSIISSAGVGYRIQTSSDNVTINGGIVRNSGLNDVYYNNFSTSSSNIDNWLRIKNLTITRNNITSRSVYVDATANKKIEIDGVSIKSVDSTTNNGTNSGICVINPYQPVKITNCIFDNMYDGIFIPTGSITGRRKNLIISNNYFLNLSYAVYADCDYGVGETIILGTNNRYEGIISGLCRYTNYAAYWEGEEIRSDYSVTMPLPNISMSSGTWVKGDRIYIDYPTTGNPYLKVVQTSGTFGTLSSVTGSITSGTKSLIVNSSSNIREGMYINIAGVTGTKRVVSVVGTTVTIDSNASATVSSAAVSYQTPSIITAITLP